MTLTLFERHAELSTLAAVVQRAMAGEGGFVAVTGPAGIGKSSLLAGAAALATESGCRVLHARATDLERMFGFGVVRQLFEPALAGAPAAEQRRLLAGAAAPAGTVLGAATDPEPVGDFAVLHGLYWLAANLASSQPLVLAVDDLHCADTGSLRFLAYLQPRLAGLRLVVAAAARSNEPGAEQRLVEALTADPVCTVLTPQPLSLAGCAAVFNKALPADPEPAFVSACWQATGGNPLLLQALARVIVVDGIAPTAANAGRVPGLGPQALATRVELRLAQLPAECMALARAVAVLEEDTPLAQAAAVAELDLPAAAGAAHILQGLQILRAAGDGPGGTQGPLVGYSHPLVRAAVYDRIDPSAREAGHAAAVRMLRRAGAGPERIASHLLQLPIDGDRQAAETLQDAARDALRRGSPDTAVVYLRRGIEQAPPAAELLDLHEQLGHAAEAVDLPLAANHLERAMALAGTPLHRADIAHRLGDIYTWLRRPGNAVEVFTAALRELPAGEVSRSRLMQAGLVNIGLIEPGRGSLLANLDELRRLPAHDSAGGRALDAVIARYDAYRGDPAAAGRARRAVTADRLVEQTSVETRRVATMVLLYAEDPAAAGLIDSAVARAYRRGTVADLAVLVFRCMANLWSGNLTGAESDARECLHIVPQTGSHLLRLVAGPYLAEVLIEQGDLAQAGEVLDAMGVPQPPSSRGPFYFYCERLAYLQRLRGQVDDALRNALAAGSIFAGAGGSNPAVTAWRSEAALCLHALGRVDQARRYALEELALARQWVAPRSLGRALRVAGLVHGGPDGLPMLREAVDVLAGSVARLEHAKALADLGGALRRAGQRAEAKDCLSRGLDAARQCGAGLLVTHAEAELRATGARPRRQYLTGPDALTPSERRVAELAAGGLTNRDIAQQLFVTVKTVEVHLGKAYRKLGIARRDQLRQNLPATAAQ